MPNKYPVVVKLLIKKSGIFDFDSVYKFLFAWFIKKKYDFHEGLYKHKPGHATGNEVEIEFKGVKKITAYYMRDIEVKIHMWDVADIPVIKDGKKAIMTKGRMTITINGTLVTDFEDRFGKSKFLENARDVFERHIIKKTIEDKHQYELYKETYQLANAIKDFLDMEVSKGG